MNTLPYEIVQDICGFLQHHSHDVASFRLVCRRHAVIGREYLFSTIYFNYHPESLARLMNISKHPEIRHHVKTLCYLTNLLRHYESLGEWREDAATWDSLDRFGKVTNRNSKQRLQLAKLTTSQLVTHYVKYRRLRKGQDQLWKTSSHSKLFAYSIAKLSNLEEIQVFNSLVRARQVGDIRSFDHHPFQSSLVAHHDPFPEDEEDGPYIPAQFGTLMMAVKTCQSTLRKLHVTELSWAALADVPSVRDAALSSLDYLSLSITTQAKERDDDEVYWVDLVDLVDTCSVQEFVRRGTNLTDIGVFFNIEFNIWRATELQSMYPFHQILGEQVFPKLHTLRTVGVGITHKEFLKCLKVHAQSLKLLHLGDCILISKTTWFNIFRKIAKILDLQECLLTGSFAVHPLDEMEPHFICAEDILLDLDLRLGDILGMAVCRKFTRGCNNAGSDEETFRIEVLREFAKNPPARDPLGRCSDLLITRNVDLLNLSLLARLEERLKAQPSKFAFVPGCSDLLEYQRKARYKTSEEYLRDGDDDIEASVGLWETNGHMAVEEDEGPNASGEYHGEEESGWETEEGESYDDWETDEDEGSDEWETEEDE
jgi:hypothetical protein